MTDKELKQFLINKTPVVIYKNNDRGKYALPTKDGYEYAVIVDDSSDLSDSIWLNVFSTEPKAIKYAIKHKLPYSIYKSRES